MKLSLLLPPAHRIAGRLAFALALQQHLTLFLLQALWTVELRVLARVLRVPRVAGDLPCGDDACARVVLCRVLASFLSVFSSWLFHLTPKPRPKLSNALGLR